ncbi:Protein CBG22605 [Caenorhabditis briggsae]|uniref:Protein CBG22605 n=1 Tax=Caenorhabditis briggsae TaxID=6238 RepID=A8Y2N3_CAEBR|nr:Protein CBG22605 [Caenorhabditis briggsae]CAP39158.2 Protein CBG22605 [Caenorhabditis briggsae]
MIVLLLLIAASATVSDPVCPNGTMIFNPFDDVSYPNGFQGQNATTLFPDNFQCEFQINVPIGWYATATMSLSSKTLHAPVQVIDQNGNVEKVFAASAELFFFLAPHGKVKLSTENFKVKFGIQIYWDQYPTMSYPTIRKLDPTTSEPIANYRNGSSLAIVESATQVSATVVQPLDENLQYLRGTIFFDGPDWNSTYLGTGFQLLSNQAQFVSTGNLLSVLYLGDFSGYDQVTVIFQDYSYTRGLTQFQAVSCFIYEYCGNFDMEGPASFITYSMHGGPEVLTSVVGSGTLDVYIGGVMKNKTIASYTAGPSYNNNLPQVFYGRIKTYILTGGNATINITRDSDTFLMSRNLERKGFIASGEYGKYSNTQDVTDRIQSPSVSSKIRYNIRSADLQEPVRMEIVEMKNAEILSRKIYNFSNKPVLNSFSEFYGSSLQVQYNTNESYNAGFYVDFEISNGSTNGFAAIFTILFCLFLLSFC